MRRPRVPKQQIAGLSAQLDPLASLSLQPLHTRVFEAVPLWRPGRDAFFVLEDFVVFRRELMAPAADDEAAVVGAVGEDVD